MWEYRTKVATFPVPDLALFYLSLLNAKILEILRKLNTGYEL
jgi:hypothetical protein